MLRLWKLIKQRTHEVGGLNKDKSDAQHTRARKMTEEQTFLVCAVFEQPCGVFLVRNRSM
jgi:hypothetical protein